MSKQFRIELLKLVDGELQGALKFLRIHFHIFLGSFGFFR